MCLLVCKCVCVMSGWEGACVCVSSQYVYFRFSDNCINF